MQLNKKQKINKIKDETKNSKQTKRLLSGLVYFIF